MTDDLNIKADGPVQHIVINRAEKMNALTGDIYAAMAEALMNSNTDKSIAVNLLYGVPGCFTAGNDINDFLSTAQTGDIDARVIDFINALINVEKPLIIAVDGPAIGIGTTMLFHADLVYASPGASFQTPFINLALLPEAASSYLIPRAIGHQRAFEMLVMGEVFAAETAMSMGFVNDIIPAANLISHAEEKAKTLAAKPQNAVRGAKRLMRQSLRDTTTKIMQDEITGFQSQLRSDEAKRAFLNFLNKSKS